MRPKANYWRSKEDIVLRNWNVRPELRSPFRGLGNAACDETLGHTEVVGEQSRAVLHLEH